MYQGSISSQPTPYEVKSGFEPRENRGRPRKYPFNRLEVGQYFTVDGHQAAMRVRSALQYYRSKNPNERFSVLQKGPQQYEVGRVE